MSKYKIKSINTFGDEKNALYTGDEFEFYQDARMHVSRKYDRDRMKYFIEDETKLDRIKFDWKIEGDGMSTHTAGGVEMWVQLEGIKDEDIIKTLESFIEDFDIDEEIELHRQAEDYKQAFTIRESVEDFESFVKEWKV